MQHATAVSIVERIGIPVYGVLHVGSHVNEMLWFYATILGPVAHSNVLAVQNTDVLPCVLLSSDDIPLPPRERNLLTVSNAQAWLPHLGSWLEDCQYVLIREDDQNVHHDLLLDQGFEEMLCESEYTFFKRRAKVYMFYMNGELRLGNIIHILINLFYNVEESSHYVYFHDAPHPLFEGLKNCLYDPKHGGRPFDQPTAQTVFLEHNTECVDAYPYDFYYKPPIIPLERDRRNIALKYISPLLPQPTASLPSTHLVIHIRSGDLFDGEHVHKVYLQPPFEYYAHVISTDAYDTISIVTEPDRKNPVIEKLCTTFPHIQVFSEELEADVQRILSAKHLMIGTGTFAYMLSLCSRHVERLYCFEYHNVYYQDSDYDIIVLGVDPEQSPSSYPVEWNGEEDVLVNGHWVIKERDMTTFQETSKRYWDEGMQ